VIEACTRREQAWRRREGDGKKVAMEAEEKV
jgi:hypothetical protein